MAARDHEGVQQFPNAADAVPNQVILEEEIELKLSTLEGHQSIGESGEDPYNKAVRYLEEHHIIEIFQVSSMSLLMVHVILCFQQNIASQIAYHRPKDPLQFMLDEIEKVRSGQKLDELIQHN